MLMHANAGGHFDPFLATLLKDQVRGSYQELRQVPLSDRTAAGQLSREQYRELACRVQDNLFLYHQKSVASGTLVSSVPIAPDPDRVALRIRREADATRTKTLRRATVARPGPRQRGRCGCRPGCGGVAETDRQELGTRDRGLPHHHLLRAENRAAKPAKLTWQTSGALTLEAEAVVTGWEVESAGDDLR